MNAWPSWLLWPLFTNANYDIINHATFIVSIFKFPAEKAKKIKTKALLKTKSFAWHWKTFFQENCENWNRKKKSEKSLVIQWVSRLESVKIYVESACEVFLVIPRHCAFEVFGDFHRLVDGILDEGGRRIGWAGHQHATAEQPWKKRYRSVCPSVHRLPQMEMTLKRACLFLKKIVVVLRCSAGSFFNTSRQKN